MRRHRLWGCSLGRGSNNWECLCFLQLLPCTRNSPNILVSPKYYYKSTPVGVRESNVHSCHMPPCLRGYVLEEFSSQVVVITGTRFLLVSQSPTWWNSKELCNFGQAITSSAQNELETYMHLCTSPRATVIGFASYKTKLTVENMSSGCTKAHWSVSLVL